MLSILNLQQGFLSLFSKKNDTRVKTLDSKSDEAFSLDLLAYDAYQAGKASFDDADVQHAWIHNPSIFLGVRFNLNSRAFYVSDETITHEEALLLAEQHFNGTLLWSDKKLDSVKQNHPELLFPPFPKMAPLHI